MCVRGSQCRHNVRLKSERVITSAIKIMFSWLLSFGLLPDLVNKNYSLSLSRCSIPHNLLCKWRDITDPAQGYTCWLLFCLFSAGNVRVAIYWNLQKFSPLLRRTYLCWLFVCLLVFQQDYSESNDDVTSFDFGSDPDQN